MEVWTGGERSRDRELVVSIERSGAVVLKIHAMGGYADFALTPIQSRSLIDTLKTHLDMLPDQARLYARRVRGGQSSGARRSAGDRVRVRLRCPQCRAEDLHIAFEWGRKDAAVTCAHCGAVLCHCTPIEFDASARAVLAQPPGPGPLIVEIKI